MERQEKRYACEFSGLPVVELPEFIGMDIGGGYQVNLRKIGNSIIHSFNEGDMKYSNIARYNQEVEKFIDAAKVNKPYIEIRDFNNLTGRAPSKQFQTQVGYLKNHESDLAGFVICSIGGLTEVILRSATKMLNSTFPLEIHASYKEGIKRAINIIESSPSEQISFDDLEFRKEWTLKNKNSEVKYGVINQKVLLTSLKGNFTSEEVPQIGELLEKVLDQGEFEGSEYIRIGDYKNLTHVGLRSRTLYSKIVDKANKKYNCKPWITYMSGTNPFMKAAMHIYRATTQQNFIFVENVEKAFQLISKNQSEHEEEASSVSVSQSDIDEIIHLGGSLVWGETKPINQLVSNTNPLLKVAETLSVIQGDLAELREKDAEQNRILSESLEKMRALTNDLRQRDEETQRLNEELRTTNNQLYEQKEQLEVAKLKLEGMNNNLENLVKERTEKLKNTVDQLNKSVSELDRFVYSASHDLGAPLKSMLGLLNIARKDEDKSQADQYLDYIEKSVYNLEDVIKSLISYSRNSRLDVENLDINVKEVVDEIISELAFLPSCENFKFDVEIPDQQIIKSDRQRLKIILHNLINNAIKYADTEKQNPFVKIKYVASPEYHEIIVQDNGIGISDDQKDRIFEMFYRGTEKSKGSGLGLFIVKETLSALDGDITLDTKQHDGSRFVIKLKINPKNPKTEI